MTTLEEAMRIVREAPAEAKMKIEMAKAVADTDLYAEARIPRSQPSMLAAQTPHNQDVAAAKEAAQAEQALRDRQEAAHREADRGELAELLAAAQSPENAYNVRRQVRTGT